MESRAFPPEFTAEIRSFLCLCRDMGWHGPYARPPRVTDPVPGLEGLREETLRCRRCGLAETRNHVVFGQGNPSPALVFVGEAPGRDEDRRGEPFVGRAGRLLTTLLRAMGLCRRDVYITNILKCRPPNNRNPLPDEIRLCEPILVRQLEMLQPRVICALGSFAARTLLKTDESIGRLRGRFHDYQGIPVMPTYHPAFLLRNPARKREVWEDAKRIMQVLKDGKGVPPFPQP